ncbi:uncharacterized protein [Physcomitrium patens]|uniref:Uncharacterized protein n=1 Tax=Physcomitrium patens TaxID=3218 RepID=A0A2K1KMQ5_PHYPA|nr:hypothetical protein PHYPA_005952 [Physcomitrium patens]
MSFSGNDYSLLGLSVGRAKDEKSREEKKSSASSTLASRMAKKISSVLRLRRSTSCSRRNSSAMVFNNSTSYSDVDESQCKYFTGESERFCPDISASRRHGDSQNNRSQRSASLRIHV